MRTTQYTSIEKKIAKGETGSIRERWQYGLRLLDDPTATTDSKKSLKHGVTEQLIKYAEHHGLKLSGREIQYRLQAARAYPTEGQIRKALADFTTWWDLIQAGFPPYPIDPQDDKPADYRTPAERLAAAGKAMLDLIGEQGSFYPLSRFEPAETTLADLVAFGEEQERITQGFIDTGKRRAEYLELLSDAVGHDLTRSWLDAHRAAFGTDDVEEDAPPTAVQTVPLFTPTIDDEPELD